MRLRNLYSYALIAGSVATLASCAGDESLYDGGEMREVRISATIGREDFLNEQTRTTLEEESGNLSCRWEAGDIVLVTDNKGTKLGVMTLQSGAGEKDATFDGVLMTNLSGEQTLNFLYLGHKTEDELKQLPNPVVIDYSTQDGEVTSLSSRDFMTSTVPVNIADGSAYTENMKLQRKVAFAHFELQFATPGLQVTTETVTISGTGLYNSAEITMSSGVDFKKIGDGTITVTGKNDFYINILPKENEKLTPVFTVEINGKHYRGTLGERQWQRTEFVRKAHGIGWPVVMEEYDPNENPGDWTDPYPDEDPRNPLHKFAKYNLTREGDASGWKNVLADSENENGALYQWGRNYGYMDTKGFFDNYVAPDNSVWDPGNDFINFLDAMGTRNNTNYPDCTFEYYVYNPNPNYYFMVSGTAMRYTPNAAYMLYYDAPLGYSTVADIKAHPTKYFMDATPGGRYMGYGNYVIGYETQNYNADYWLSKFGDGGSIWEKRAELCGYDRTNPCPDGWRIPSYEDFKAIAPEGGGIDITSNLANKLTNYYEDRQTPDGVRYIIRWIYSDSAITVEAVVVDNNFSGTVNSLFWDQNRNKKVVRVFPYTGAIQPLIALCDGYYMANDHYVVRPHNRGLADGSGIPGGYGDANNYYWMLFSFSDVNGANAAFGGYWTSDKNHAFKFEAKEKYNGKNNSNATIQLRSCLKMDSGDPVMGYAIRPVMDKPAATK